LPVRNGVPLFALQRMAPDSAWQFLRQT